MAAIDPQTLLAAASCYQCNSSSEYQLTLIKLGLLQQLALASNPMADTTPQALLAAASCYQCFASSPYMLQLIELGLLTQIAGGGGVGPGTEGSVRTGHGAPDSPGGTLPLFYVDLDCSTEWTWDPLTLAWTELDREKQTGSYRANTVADLRNIPTLVCDMVEAHTFGNLVDPDEQPSWYQWNPDIIVDPDTGLPDTGMSLIKPNDRADGDPGRWVQVVFA